MVWEHFTKTSPGALIIEESSGFLGGHFLPLVLNFSCLLAPWTCIAILFLHQLVISIFRALWEIYCAVPANYEEISQVLI